MSIRERTNRHRDPSDSDSEGRHVPVEVPRPSSPSHIIVADRISNTPPLITTPSNRLDSPVARSWDD